MTPSSSSFQRPLYNSTLKRLCITIGRCAGTIKFQGVPVSLAQPSRTFTTLSQQLMDNPLIGLLSPDCYTLSTWRGKVRFTSVQPACIVTEMPFFSQVVDAEMASMMVCPILEMPNYPWKYRMFKSHRTGIPNALVTSFDVGCRCPTSRAPISNYNLHRGPN